MMSDRIAPGTINVPALEADRTDLAAMYRGIVEDTSDIIVLYDAGRTCIYVSPASRDLLGYQAEELLGGIERSIIHPDDLVRVRPNFLALGPANTKLRAAFRVRRKDGVTIWIEGHYRYLPADGSTVGVMRDITGRRNIERLLQQANETLAAANEVLLGLADRDSLTRLPNGRRFEQLLGSEFGRATRQSCPVAVLLIAVDSFPTYYDRHGQAAGDECLCRISRAVEAALERPGDCAARYGDDQFAVLLPDTDLIGAMVVAGRIRDAIAGLRIEHLCGVHRVVTVSIGARSVSPRSDVDPGKLLEAATRALHRARSDGGNRVRGGGIGVLAHGD